MSFTVLDYYGEAKTMQKVVPGNVVFGVSPYVYTYKEFYYNFNSGGAATPVIGDWILGATTKCQAKIISIGTLASGAWGDSDAVGTMRIASVHGSATSTTTYFDGSENISLIATANEMTMTSNIREVMEDYPMRNAMAKAMIVNVLTQTALCCWDGSTPDQTQLIGISMIAGSSVLLKDINSIKNFKFIDRVSGSASTVEMVLYF